VRRASVAETIIAVATTRDRAAAVVGDLLEEDSSGSRARFWWNVAGAALAFAWLNVVRFIFRRHSVLGAYYGEQVMDFWRFMWRRKWLLVVPVVLSTIGATILAYRMPFIYRSETQIIVVPQRVPATVVPLSGDTRLENRIRSIKQQVLSRTRLERIVTEFALYREERTHGIMEDVIQRMRDRDIAVEAMPGREGGDPGLFTLSFQSTDSKIAMRVTERLASLFISENLQDRSRQAENTSIFIEGQIDELARNVDEFAVRIERDRLARRRSPRSVVLEYEELQNTYRELLQKRQQARLAASLESRQIGEQFKIIEPARIPARPEGPERLSVGLFGAGAGLAAGLLLLLVASMKGPTPPTLNVAAAPTATE
jgi:uncharacterized protein involved in exopolysaccharide biosynthesis